MVCLDTSFIIDVLRGKKEVLEIEKKLDRLSEAVTIASPSIMELIVGVRLSNNPQIEEEKINSLLSSLIVLNLDRESAVLAGNIKADLTKKGDLIDIEDILIGAIAKHNNETIITKNPKHFEKIKGLTIESY
ncbi:MAG: PIN domain-containing protein [Nanoarchaeota archaeon]